MSLKINNILISLLLSIVLFITNNIYLQLISILIIVFMLLKDNMKINIIPSILIVFNYTNILDTYIFSILYLILYFLFKQYINIIYKLINPFSDINLFVKVKKNNKEVVKSIRNVKIGDLLIIDKNDYILVNSSVQTGTSKVLNIFGDDIVNVKNNTLIKSGYKNIDKKIIVKVEELFKDSLFYKKYNYFNDIVNDKSSFIKIINNISFVISVILLIIYIVLYIVNNSLFLIPIYFILIIYLLNIYINVYIKYMFIKMFDKDIYFKNQDVFFNLNKVKNIFFSKTGVITTGEYKITKVVSEDKDLLLYYLIHGEYLVDNKISNVIKNYIDMDVDINRIKNHKFIEGKGITYKIDKHNVIIGNYYFIKNNKIDIEIENNIGTIIYVVVDKEVLGYIVISDTIKKSVKNNLNLLKKYGINNLVILSGDNSKIVSVIANEVGIKDYYSNLNIFEKAFWYVYVKGNNKGKSIYVRNKEFDKDKINSDINILMSKDEYDICEYDILIKNDIHNIVRVIRYIKSFRDTLIKNMLIFIIFILLDVLVLCLGIKYLSILLVLNIIMFMIMFYDNYKL